MTISHSAGAGRTPGRGPEVWGKIPPRNKNFTGREEMLARLRDGIAGKPTAVVSYARVNGPHALHGLGGVGKTQMAVEYAYRFSGDYDLVWWVPADQPVLLRSSLAGLAPRLGLPDATSTGIEDTATAVLDALRRGEPYDRWLLIFDNADQPEDLQRYLPQGPGHVLITSRNHRWESVVDTVSVDVFARSESVDFLAKRVPKGIDPAEADLLAERLGDLPLALEQAGALQAETGMPASEYMTLLAESTSKLLAEGKPSEYPVSMTAAWGLSVTSLGTSMPEAVELLRCCAFFGPEPIPRAVFAKAYPGLGESLAGLLGEPIRLSRAIGQLGRFALARVDVSKRTIQVHRLIQALLRDDLGPGEHRRIQDDVHLLLVNAAPTDPESTTHWKRYAELLGHVEPAKVEESRNPPVRRFALDVVRYLNASGDHHSARAFAQRFIDRWSEGSGDTDLEVIEAQRLLGNALRELGDYKAAYEQDQTALKRAETTVGLDHEVALRLSNGIGADLRAAGDFRAAREQDADTLRRHEQVFGPADARTLLVVNSMALDHGLNSDYQGARALHERAYTGLLHLGEENVPAAMLLATWNGLARAVRLCGDYAEACDVGEDVYAYGIEELGPTHPWTLRAGKDLSIAWRRLGDLDRARELAEEVHRRLVRLYGLDHPDTLAAAMCLANLKRSAGDVAEAAELAQDTVNRYPRAYGPDHPYNWGCSGNLALLLRVLQRPAEARELNERSATALNAALDRDHHYSLTVAMNLASDLAALGDIEGAVRMERETFDRSAETLGADHPLTLACAANLSVDLRAGGWDEEGRLLQEKTIARYIEVLGQEHPDTQAALAGRHLDIDFDPPPI